LKAKLNTNNKIPFLKHLNNMMINSIMKTFKITKSWGLFCISLSLLVFFVLIANSSLVSAQSNPIKQSAQSTSNSNASSTNIKNIILVHGAFSDGSAWSQVIPILEKAGHRVIAVQLPEHSLSDDVATVKRAIDFVKGPSILVGHSYGGLVISNAAYNNPNVKGLVFIAALALKDGQSYSDVADFNKIPKDLFVADKGGFIYLNSTKFHDSFAQDVNLSQADIMTAVQKPINQSILAEKSGPPAWKQIPSWYQISENDRSIPPSLQHLFAKQINATTISIPSSHASLVSHPHEVAQLILNATKGIRK
jgi:pimeloyl-ACP methyl ester carboxylesterase